MRYAMSGIGTARAVTAAGLVSLSGVPLAFGQDSQSFRILCAARDGLVVAGSEGAWRVAGQPMIWSLNADGSVLAEGAIRGGGVTSDDNGAVFLLGFETEPRLLMRESDPVAGGFFRRVYQLFSDDAGNVAMLAEIGEIIYGGNQFNGPHFQAVLAGPPDELAVVASEPIHGEPTQLRQSASGAIAFFTPDSLWFGDPNLPGDLVPVITPGVLPAGLPADSTNFGIHEDGGLFLFPDGRAWLAAVLQQEPEDGPIVRTNGLWIHSEGSVSQVASERDAAPGWNGLRYHGGFTLLGASDTGWIVFRVGVDDDGVFPIVGTGHFAGRPGEIARFDFPLGPDVESYILGIDDGGRVLVRTGGIGDAALWISGPEADSSDWTRVMEVGEPAAGIDGAYLSIEHAHLGADGTILIGVGTSTGVRGVWVQPPGEPLAPAAVRFFKYDRGAGLTGTILSHSDLTRAPTTILPYFGTVFGGGGGMSLVRGHRFPVVIRDACSALVALDEQIGGPPARAAITMRRVETGYTLESRLAGRSDVEAPLVPVADPILLGQQPAIDGGLVVDGVTPVVFEVVFEEFEEGATFSAALDHAYPSLRLLDTEANPPTWVDAAGRTLAPSTGNATFHFSVPPPSVEAFPDLDGAHELAVHLVVTELDGGGAGPTASLSFALRRPPIGLGSLGGEWSAAFRDVIRARRGEGFDFSDGESLSEHWAFTRWDVVMQGGRASSLLNSLESESFGVGPFRKGEDGTHWRGAWRRLVDVGGSAPVPVLHRYIEALGVESAVPESIKRRIRPSTSTLVSLLRTARLDDAARIHSLATGIPMVPGAGPFLSSIGLTTSDRLSEIFPWGSDGIVDRNAALRIAGDAVPSAPWHSVFAGEPVAHLAPELFGVEQAQQTSTALAHHVLDLLESPEAEGRFASAATIRGSMEFELSEETQSIVEQVADEVTIDYVDRRRTELESIGILPFLAGGAAEDAEEADEGGDVVCRFTLVPAPEHPVAGDVWWMAEIYGQGGASTDGLVLASSGENAANLELTVAEGLVGEVIVYGGYSSTEGILVHMPPVIGWSQEPAGTTLTGIEVRIDSGLADQVVVPASPPEPEPGPVRLDASGTVRPSFHAVYEDGTRLARLVDGEEVTATSSDPAVVDAGDPLEWMIAGPGDATVEIEWLGFTTSIDVVVPGPGELFAIWLAGQFTPEELADPMLAGPEVDADGDGIPNLGEWALLGDPRAPDAAALFRVEIAADAPVIVLQLGRDSGARVRVEGSPDLSAWQTHYDPGEDPEFASPLVLGREALDGGDILVLAVGEAVAYRLSIEVP